MRVERILLLACLCLALAQGLRADPFAADAPLPDSVTRAAAESPAAVADPPSPVTGLFMRAGLGLLIISGLAAGGVWFLRRNPSMRRYLGSAGVVRVVARTWLGSKTGVYLIKVGDRLLLVGASSAGLRTLTEITDPTQVTRLLAESEGEHAKGQASFRDNFRDTLKSAIRRPEPKGSEPPRRERPATEASTRVVSPLPEDTEGARKLAAIRAELARLNREEVAV